MTDSGRLQTAILIGSVREGRFAPVVANWFTSYIQQREEFLAHVIDLAETELPEVLSRNPGPAVGRCARGWPQRTLLSSSRRSTTTAFPLH